MPWRETCAMDQRVPFVIAACEAEAVVSRLCREFRISRETGYKWLRRYREVGFSRLEDRSRAPHRHDRVSTMYPVQSVSHLSGRTEAG